MIISKHDLIVIYGMCTLLKLQGTFTKLEHIIDSNVSLN